MLVVSRKKNETFIITAKDGSTITVTVIDIDRGKVRLGIEAPRDIPIWREEIRPAVGLHVPGPPPDPDLEAEIMTAAQILLQEDGSGSNAPAEATTPYALARLLLERCALAELRDLELLELRKIKGVVANRERV